jgi:hypothetical protein
MLKPKLNLPLAVLAATLFYPTVSSAKPVNEAATAENVEPIEKISVSYHQAYRGNVPDQELPQAI